MDTRTIRRTIITLPGEEPEDLDPVEHLPGAGETLTECVVSGGVWTRAELSRISVSRSWFRDADLDSATLNGWLLDRCVLRRCTLIGSRWQGVTLKNVIFENCRIDYALFTDLKLAGPVAWVGCSMTEVGFARGTLAGAAFDGCRLNGITFEGSDLRGADLRGNDISVLAPGARLNGLILSESQVPALTELLLGELAIEITPDSPSL